MPAISGQDSLAVKMAEVRLSEQPVAPKQAVVIPLYGNSPSDLPERVTNYAQMGLLVVLEIGRAHV